MPINWTNITTIEQIPAAANNSAPFWTMILYMIYFIMIISLSYWGIIPALLSSSFIGLLIGLFLVYAGLVPWQYVITFLAVIIGCIVYIILFDRQN
jgi:ABC-type multidrug transport system permease subunit